MRRGIDGNDICGRLNSGGERQRMLHRPSMRRTVAQSLPREGYGCLSPSMTKAKPKKIHKSSFSRITRCESPSTEPSLSPPDGAEVRPPAAALLATRSSCHLLCDCESLNIDHQIGWQAGPRTAVGEHARKSNNGRNCRQGIADRENTPHPYPVGHRESNLARNSIALEFTLGAQDFHEALLRLCFGISVEMHDIIEITWACPFHECSEFFRESLDVIRPGLRCHLLEIAVWMENLGADRRQNHPLVGG